MYSYFKQCFAQVTNPPIDPIREELVMSLDMSLGSKPNIFSKPDDNNCFRLELSQPIIKNEEMMSLASIEKNTNGRLKCSIIDILFKNSNKGEELKDGIDRICYEAKNQILEGSNILILSDRNISNVNAPIPALLAASAVHHFLIKEGLRMKASLVMETGEARELHHFSVLFGYGIEAINPYLAFDTIKNLTDKKDWAKAENNFIKASQKAVLKIMSKMGISTLKSYCGAQIFDAIGISEDVINKYFCGTSTLIGGINLSQIQKETLDRFNKIKIIDSDSKLDDGGEYAFRINGEEHAWSPSTISNLQKAARINSKESFKKFSDQINGYNKSIYTIRSLFEFKKTKPIPIDEVELSQEIVKRFATGAMSFGSISREAHTTLALAMNRIGGKSNTWRGWRRTRKVYSSEKW